jgi:hypothetical protein
MVRFGFASCGKQVPYSLLGGQGKVTFTNGTRPDFKALPRRFMMSRQAAMAAERLHSLCRANEVHKRVMGE